jgi:2-methylcitrate dehydratase PrpD
VSGPVQHAATDMLLGAINGMRVEPADSDAANALIADAVACMVGAQASEAAQPVIRWARKQPQSAQTHALVLGALSNVLEMDAMHVASSVHPGTVVVPAALAVAVDMASTGPDLAKAVLRGTEAAIRLGRSTGAVHRQRFQSTSTCGGFGAALACADLMGLSHVQTVDAMSNMASIAGGLWAFLEEDSLTKQWHAGKAAEGAVIAAQLAAEGLRGAHHVLDGRRGFLAVLCDGGKTAELWMHRERWQLHDTAYKPWPSPRPTHAAITAALDARARIGDVPIDHVLLRTYGMAVDLCNRHPITNAHDARFSLRYCTAVALSRGVVEFRSFESDEIARHASLASRIEVREDRHMTLAYPESSQAALDIFLSNGETFCVQVDHALGDPGLPVSEEQRLQKFSALLELAFIPADSNLRDDITTMCTGARNPAVLLNNAFRDSGLTFNSRLPAVENFVIKDKT